MQYEGGPPITDANMQSMAEDEAAYWAAVGGPPRERAVAPEP